MPEYQSRPERVSAMQFIDSGALPPGVVELPGGGFAHENGTRVAFSDYVLADGRVMTAEAFGRAYALAPSNADPAPEPPARATSRARS